MVTGCQAIAVPEQDRPVAARDEQTIKEGSSVTGDGRWPGGNIAGLVAATIGTCSGQSEWAARTTVHQVNKLVLVTAR